ncbi:dephospho-CoA kinase [Pseudoalteromonas tunicata]|uniref:dephospho-CoA kinase n=1 Tax=Pseudoalteromonas tunicata TaxID=314281 RepID=UPI00273F85D0|nr:dephospho-CoA kinase [Pseudoalteromonas tunicata]MDP4985304.1 dephospho-CoA kinase [Pseudoalteromonas tunicata]
MPSNQTKVSKKIIGLTGGIGSGKSAVANMFAALGIDLVDADIVAREVVAIGSPALAAIKQYFGEDFLNQDGSLNRSKLRERVFSQVDDKLWLNNLLHPLIRSEILAQLHQASSPYVLLVAPLLFENKLNELCDHSVLVDVPVATQLQRTSTRDNCTIELVQNIIAAQMPRAQKQALADDTIDNSLALDHTKKQVTALHQKLLALT